MASLLLLALCLCVGAQAFRLSASRRPSSVLSAAARGGSVVALVTPMTEANAVDYPRLEQLLAWHAAEGSDGVVVLGTTGEASTISPEDRARIISASVAAVNGKMPVIVGTGAIEADKVIAMSAQALALGADATLVITPYYVKPPQRALVKHFTSIADAVNIPMILYNCPGRTGVDMKPETLSGLFAHPNIIGIKDATGDLARVESLRRICGKDFLLYTGEDDNTCEFVRLGGDGVISVTANVAPGPMSRMLRAAREGRHDDATAINSKLALLHNDLFLESNPIPVKRALQLMGRIGAGIRPPLTSLDDALLDKLRAALSAGGILL